MLERFQRSHSLPHWNPILTWWIVIDFNLRGHFNDLEFGNAIGDLLGKYARHIYQLCACVNNNFPASFYPLLQRWISLTDNTKASRLLDYYSLRSHTRGLLASHAESFAKDCNGPVTTTEAFGEFKYEIYYNSYFPRTLLIQRSCRKTTCRG